MSNRNQLRSEMKNLGFAHPMGRMAMMAESMDKAWSQSGQTSGKPKAKSKDDCPWGSLESGERMNLIVHEVSFVDKNPTSDNYNEQTVYSAYYVSPDTIGATEKQLTENAEELKYVNLKGYNSLSYVRAPSIEGIELTGGRFCGIDGKTRDEWQKESPYDAKKALNKILSEQNDNQDIDKACPELRQASEQLESRVSWLLGKDVEYLGSRVCTVSAVHKSLSGDIDWRSVTPSTAHPEGISAESLKTQFDNVSKVNEINTEKQQQREKWRNIGRRFIDAVTFNNDESDKTKDNDQYGQ